VLFVLISLTKGQHKKEASSPLNAPQLLFQTMSQIVDIAKRDKLNEDRENLKELTKSLGTQVPISFIILLYMNWNVCIFASDFNEITPSTMTVKQLK
jgi:hypothetical protein